MIHGHISTCKSNYCRHLPLHEPLTLHRKEFSRPQGPTKMFMLPPLDQPFTLLLSSYHSRTDLLLYQNLAFLIKVFLRGIKVRLSQNKEKTDCLQNQVIYSYAPYLYIQTPLTQLSPQTALSPKGTQALINTKIMGKK